jgi:hypothetical protein
MSEQTKREWTAEARDYSEEYWVGEDHYVVGPIDSWTEIITGFRHREDATLVAAAPDLLAALEALLPLAEKRLYAEHDSIIQAAHDAIKKARDTSLPANIKHGIEDYYIERKPE